MTTVRTKNDAENVIRQTIPHDPRDPDPAGHLQSGYEEQVATDFYIPPCGLEDCDKTLFKLFDKTIGFSVKNIWSMNKSVEIPKPLVIFATGERFAATKKSHPPLDKNRNLLLPAVSIRRTDISQTFEDRQRGMNQTTGIMTIKRKLDHSDRDYQNFINKLALRHMTLTPTVSTTREDPDRGVDQRISQLEETREGGLLAPHIGNNIYEIITIPQPQFFTATYEIVFWTSYTQHMNYMIETLNASFLPQGRMFKLVTDKGYWFMAYVQDETTNGSNYDDFKDSKRIVRYSFNVQIKGFMLATSGDNNMVPIRRWVSSPSITFDVQETDKLVVDRGILSKQVGSRENNVDGANGLFSLTDEQVGVDPRHAQARTTDEKLLFEKDVWDPRTGRKQGVRYVTQLQSNEKRGETVFRASDAAVLEEFIKTLR